MLSKEQNNSIGDFSTFKKTLNYRTVNGIIEIELSWDNGEVSWEPAGVIRKDDPVTLALYIKENIFLDKRGRKWNKRVAKNEKKLV